MHLLIPHAAPPGPACRAALGGLSLPHVQALLSLLSPAWSLSAQEDQPHPAFELAHAKALGLPLTDGLLPWAALAARETGLGADADYALMTLCHWDIHTHNLFMPDPAQLALGEDESRALLASMRPYFEEDGLQLHALRAHTWLLAGEVLRGLPTASLERVRNAPVDPWAPRQASARTLSRLHNEMQMLLYHHPVNNAREARGAPTVNAFWLHGSGALPPHWQPPPAPPMVDDRLRQAAVHDDASAWADAWQALDQGPVQALLQAARQGASVQLTLASESQARSLRSAPRSWWGRLQRRISPVQPSVFLQTL
ncbi:MAG: phosphoglycerate mutase [Rhodoferax sp.]